MAAPIRIGNQTVSFYDPEDEERKRRMAFGKAQGLDEATIQRYELIAQMQKRQQQQTARQQPEQVRQPEQKPQGAFRANSLLGFGTSLLPFGEVLRKKLNNEKVSAGDVALETALSALPFAGKLVGKGVKAAKGLTKSGQAAAKTAAATGDVNKEKNLLKALITGNPEEGVLAGRLTKAGESLKAQARGVVPGVKPQGAAEKLLPSQADEINRTLNRVERKKTFLGRTKTGAKGSVNKQLRTVETAQTKALDEMDRILGQNNVSFGNPARNRTGSFGLERRAESVPQGRLNNLPQSKPKVNDLSTTSSQRKADIRQGIVKDFRADRKSILGLKPEHTKEALDLEKRVLATKDTQGLESLRRAADKRINFARNPNSPDPALEEVYLSLRRNIDKRMTELVPGLKDAKTNYGKLEAAKDTLIQSSPATMRQFAGQGPTARLMGGSVVQNLTDKAGRVLTRAGKVAASPITQAIPAKAYFSTANAFGASQSQTAQAETGLPADVSLVFAQPRNQDEELLNTMVAQGITDPQEMFDSLTQFDQPEQAAETTSLLGASSVELFNQALQEPDVKRRKELLDFAQVAAEFEASAAKGQDGQKLSATQQKEAAKLSAAGEAINQTEELFKSAGGAKGLVGFGSKAIAGLRGPNPQLEAYNKVRRTAAISLARAFGETGPLSNQDIEMYAGLLPDVTDSAEAARITFEAIRKRLESISYNPGAATNTGLGDINQLFNQQGAY